MSVVTRENSMRLFKKLISLIMVTVFVSISFAMRTPLSSFDSTINPLKTEAIKYELEAVIYREEIMRYEQNRIFFLIKPYIETRLRMG